MEHLNSVATFLAVYASGLALLQAIGQLLHLHLNAGRFLSAFLLLWFSVLTFNLGMGRDWIFEHLPYLYSIHVPFYFVAGPIFRSYMLGVVFDSEDEFSEILPLRFPGYKRLIPFFIAMIVYIPFFVMNGDTKNQLIYSVHPDTLAYSYRITLFLTVYAGLVSAIYSIFRILFEIRIVKLLNKEDVDPGFWHLRIIILWFGIITILAIPIQFIDTIELKKFTGAALAVPFFWLYFLDFRYPFFVRKIDYVIRTEKRNEKYSRSRIQGLNSKDILERLDRTMIEERLYADEDLTLERLALISEISPHQLSELLNSVVGTDFRTYINRFRVEEACRMLLEEPDRNILSIGFAVGFNSKSSLNRNFKQIMGVTPAEYKNRKIDRSPDS